MELNREHFRVILQQQCIDKINSIFGDEAPLRTSVYRWYGEFNRSRSSLQDEFREGRPIDAVRKLILAINATLGISGTSLHSILHELSKKICSHWIPHNLSIAQKLARVVWSKEMLQKYDRDVYNIVISDKSWIYAYEPESK